MKIMTFNVGIWTRNAKKSDPNYWKPRMAAMQRMLLITNPDVICFQELWWPATLYIPKCYKKVRGTGLEHPIYVRKGIEAKGEFHFRWSRATLKNAIIYNIHSHWDREKIEKDCREIREDYLKSAFYPPSVICGDWNNEWEVVESLLPECRNIREWMELPKVNTYQHFKDPTRAAELDFFAVPGFAFVKDYQVVTRKFMDRRVSDHYPVVIKI